MDAEMLSKPTPKWIPNRYQNFTTIDSQIGSKMVAVKNRVKKK
jgi:hypothetical protein